MSLEITNPKDTRYVKALIFSPPGHGKTHFLGTAQEDERTFPMLLLDFEGGDETLSGLDIDVAKIRTWDDYSEAFEILSAPDCKYQSVGIDSVSETHVWALLSIIEKKGPTRNEPDLIEQGDYGIATTQMRRLLREFRDLPLHVFYTAHSREIEERGIGKVKVPKMAGQMAEEVVGLMSIVGYLAVMPSEDEDEDIDRILLLQNDPGFRTKVRSPWKQVVPNELENPSMTDLLDALHVGDFVRDVPDEDPEPEPDDDDPDGEVLTDEEWVESLTVPQLRKEIIARDGDPTGKKKPDLKDTLLVILAEENE